jgi:hypothetical protein
MKTKKFIRSKPYLPVKNLRETLNYYRDVPGFYDERTGPRIGLLPAITMLPMN